MYIIPIGIVLPFLLYSLASPYTQLLIIFQGYESDASQALIGKEIEAQIYDELLNVVQITSGIDEDLKNSGSVITPLNELRQRVKDSIAEYKETFVNEKQDNKDEEIETFKKVEDSYAHIVELEDQSIELAKAGNYADAIGLLLIEADSYLDDTLLPNLETVIVSESQDVSKDLPTLVNIVSRFGVIPVPSLVERMDSADIDFKHAILTKELVRSLDNLLIDGLSALITKGQTNAEGVDLYTVFYKNITDLEVKIDNTISQLKLTVNSENNTDKEEELTEIQDIENSFVLLKDAITSINDTLAQPASSREELAALVVPVDNLVVNELTLNAQSFNIKEESNRKSTIDSLSDYLNRLVITIYLVCIMVFLIGVLALINLSRQILSPVIKLKNAAQKVSEGDLNTKVDINSRDEIGELAKVFNSMVEKIRNAYSELENKVKERTSELEALKSELETKVTEKTSQLEKKESETEQIKALNNAMIGRELEMVKLKEEIAKLKGEK